MRRHKGSLTVRVHHDPAEVEMSAQSAGMNVPRMAIVQLIIKLLDEVLRTYPQIDWVETRVHFKPEEKHSPIDDMERVHKHVHQRFEGFSSHLPHNHLRRGRTSALAGLQFDPEDIGG